MSILALPSYEILSAGGAVDPATGPWQRAWTLWLLRVLTGGLSFALIVILVGRAAEAIAPGTGALTAVAVGVGTFALGLAATVFAHLAAGALGFLAFLLLISARSGHGRSVNVRFSAAGLAIGTAILFDYLAGIILLALLAYAVATTRSAQKVGLFIVGGIPAATALAVYNLLAFGSPLRLSYNYITGWYGRQQRHGLLGSGSPKLGYLEQVMTSQRGIILTSPIIIVAVAGLALLWHQHRAETATCLAIISAFFVYSIGYFEPLGGTSPGPRFLAPAIPFAAIGLAPLVQRRPRLTATLVAVSAAGAIADGVRWASPPSHTTWMLIDLNPALAGLLVAVPGYLALVAAMRQAIGGRERRLGAAPLAATNPAGDWQPRGRWRSRSSWRSRR